MSKAVVMLVTDASTDDVKEAANEALAAGKRRGRDWINTQNIPLVQFHCWKSHFLEGVSVFPIGVGPNYNRNELTALGRHHNQDNTLHLTSMDQLLMLLTLDHSYIDRICRGAYTLYAHRDLYF